jgi:hypothetical protein
MEDNIKVGIKEIECEGVNCIRLVHEEIQCWAFVNTIMKLQVP